MGWTVSYDNTKEQEIESILRGFTNGCEARKHCLRGKHLWMIVDGPEFSSIALAVLVNGSPDMGWGHKLMDETAGPCYYDCPVSWLDEVPPPSGRWVEGWRQAVREHHARKRLRKGLAIGQAWTVASGYVQAGQHCKLTRKRKRGWHGEIGGTVYRVMPRMLAKRVA